MSHSDGTPQKDPKLLFGNIAVGQGFVTYAQIEECKRYQDQQRAQGVQPDRIGDLLVNRGYLTPAQVKEIFRIQGREGGHTQISGYELIEQIGKGAMGVVYRARQISMERIVAIKILYPKLARNQNFVERFISEARASARLNHPNIITGIDVGEIHKVELAGTEARVWIRVNTPLRSDAIIAKKQTSLLGEYALQLSPGYTGEPLQDGAWAVRIYVKPFVNWIWGGCVLMALGGLLAVADRRYRLRARAAQPLPRGAAAA